MFGIGSPPKNLSHCTVFSSRQVYFEFKQKWGATESFSDIDLSLVSGKVYIHGKYVFIFVRPVRWWNGKAKPWEIGEFFFFNNLVIKIRCFSTWAAVLTWFGLAMFYLCSWWNSDLFRPQTLIFRSKIAILNNPCFLNLRRFLKMAILDLKISVWGLNRSEFHQEHK